MKQTPFIDPVSTLAPFLELGKRALGSGLSDVTLEIFHSYRQFAMSTYPDTYESDSLPLTLLAIQAYATLGDISLASSLLQVAAKKGVLPMIPPPSKATPKAFGGILAAMCRAGRAGLITALDLKGQVIEEAHDDIYIEMYYISRYIDI